MSTAKALLIALIYLPTTELTGADLAGRNSITPKVTIKIDRKGVPWRANLTGHITKYYGFGSLGYGSNKVTFSNDGQLVVAREESEASLVLNSIGLAHILIGRGPFRKHAFIDIELPGRLCVVAEESKLKATSERGIYNAAQHEGVVVQSHIRDGSPPTYLAVQIPANVAYDEIELMIVVDSCDTILKR